MAKSITLPKLGEGIDAGDIVNVFVSQGDVVNRDQTLMEIETDKAVVEFPSPDAGRITRVLVKPGDHVMVGAPLFEIDAGGVDGGESKPAAERPKTEKAPAEAPKKAESAQEKQHVKGASASAATQKASKPATAKRGAAELVKLPQLGEGIEGGDVLNVMVAPGDTIAKDQSIAEVETDKAVVEVPSPVSGRIADVLIKAGDRIKVGADLIRVETDATGERLPGAKESAAAVAPVADKKPAEAASISKEERPVPRKEPAPATRVPEAQREVGRIIPAGPAARRLARELGVDLSRVRGTASGDRITVDDVKAFVRSGGIATVSQESGGARPAEGPQLPDFAQWGPIDRKPVSSLRRKIAEQLMVAWTAPMVTHFDEADVTELEGFRKKFAPRVKEAGGALTMTTLAIKAVIEGLKEFPQMNASFDVAKGELVIKNYYHISVAVDTAAGLIVPVIRNADKKSLRDLAIELSGIAQRARDRKVSVEELQGGTFTISNLGGIGGTGFTPLLNWPQVGILGLARGSMKAVWREGRFEPRLVMPISVTYDHRVIDGADGARFTRRVARAFEEFTGALLDV